MGELNRNGLFIGYLTIAVLAAAPLLYAYQYTGVIEDVGTPPYVVFALLVALGIVPLRPLWLMIRLHPSPTRQLIADAKAYAPWLLTCLFILLALVQTLDAVGAVKRLIPHVNPFWADPWLVDLDRLIFLGNDGWQVTRQIIPEAMTRPLDFLYRIWHPIHVIFCAILALLLDRKLQLRAVIAFQLSWIILGNILAMILSSVGPIFITNFWNIDGFDQLFPALQAENAKATIWSSRYLLESDGTNAFGAGISAMPSMHVGVVVIIALFMRERFPRWQVVGWLFALITYFSSIHLGYHYATDGIVSAIGALLIWRAAGFYVNWLTKLPPYMPKWYSAKLAHSIKKTNS